MPNVTDVELFYPRVEGSVDTIEIGLTDVRAADSIRVTYDFDRDGWAVLQEKPLRWVPKDHAGSTVHELESEWVEVAFVQAWGQGLPEDAPGFYPEKNAAGRE